MRQSLTAANERPRSLWRSNIRSLSISRRLHHRQIGWFHTLENPCGVEPGLAIPVVKVRTVTDETARFGKFAPCVTWRAVYSGPPRAEILKPPRTTGARLLHPVPCPGRH